jgi:ABC-type molybdate transport system ATPase subunit
MNNIKLTNGGIVTDIKFMNNETHILCMNSQRRFIQYKFDECLTFQKLSVEEQLILMAYEQIEKDS